MTHSSSTTHKNDVWVGILLCHIQEGGYVTFFLVHITHHSYVWHDSFTCVTWLIHTCDMTRSYGWSDSFLCVVWLIPLAQHMKMMCEWVFYCEHIQEGGYVTLFQCIPQIITLCHMTFFFFLIHTNVTHIEMSHAFHKSLLCVTWLIHIYSLIHTNVTHIEMSHAFHSSLLCVTWLIHSNDYMITWCVIITSLLCVTWLIHIFDMTRSYGLSNSFLCVIWLVPLV